MSSNFNAQMTFLIVHQIQMPFVPVSWFCVYIYLDDILLNFPKYLIYIHQLGLLESGNLGSLPSLVIFSFCDINY